MIGRIPAVNQTGMTAFLEQLQQGTENQRATQKLLQEKIANEQLNKYRMGELSNTQKANEQLNQYRMGQLGLEKEALPSKLALQEAQANYYNMGGRSGGVGLKDQMSLMKQIMMDNKGVTLDRANEISNAWLNGQSTLSDGTPVPPPSGNSSVLLDRINKGRTTSQQLNQIVNAKGGEAEIDTLTNLSQQWNKPYGSTYFNMNPQQIVDTFKNDEKSQTQLGEFIAAQQLQFEIAQIQNRLAMGQPGITNTHELMERGMQSIDARYPRLSQKAREIAQKRFTYALKKGLESRQSVGIGASTAFQKSGGNKPVKNWKVEGNKLVEA